jgi:flagellar basal-body rod protein FlgC
MALFRAMNISASALTAQRFRMDIISENLANAEVTRTADGGPYRRRTVVMGQRQDTVSFRERLNGYKNSSIGDGVVVARTEDDMSDFKLEYNPTHPDANAEGYVSYPNVDTVTEMVDMLSASRSYEANVTAFNTTKSMAQKALELGK